ncbi:S8 family serine peptidase [Haloplanus natans]|uniref:S8 family serine peptidase n=1 Tax=Haloplanus natans TaxID=376171 RepID=UPI000A019909
MTTERGPLWSTSVKQTRDYIIRAHGLSTNVPRTGERADGIHIGVVDSAWQLPSEYTDGYTVHERRENSFLNTSEEETSQHCRAVFDRLCAYAPDAEFSLYQAMNADKRVPVEPYSDVVTKAIEDDIDILNLSSGRPWRAPVALNPDVKVTKRLINAGITVVAAAGNYLPNKQERRPPVHCPGAFEDVISVGGMVTHCPCEPGDEPANRRAGPYYWVNEDVAPESDVTPANGTFCSEQDCTNGQNCIPNQQEKEWKWNPVPTGSNPDILAPMHVLRDSSDGWYLEPGTSFATPLVTGSLACILCEHQSETGEEASPYDLRRAVREGSSRIHPDASAGKYDAMGTRCELGLS